MAVPFVIGVRLLQPLRSLCACVLVDGELRCSPSLAPAAFVEHFVEKCMNISAIRLALLAICTAVPALAAQDNERRAAQMSVVSLDLTSADIVAWCDAAGAGAAVRPAYAAWRTQHGIDDLTRGLDPATLRLARDASSAVIASSRQKLAAMGTPARVCPRLSSMWSSQSFDARARFPSAYPAMDVASDARPASAATSAAVVSSAGNANARSSDRVPAPMPKGSFDERDYAAVARPVGTLFTASQLHTLTQSWWGSPRSYERANEMRRRSGVLFIRGRVVKRNDRFYIEDNDGVFRSRMTIAPGIGIAAFEGQDITVQGTLDELPSSSLLFLRGTRVVRDPSGLTPSPLSTSAGRYRLTVAEDRITAPAGRGLRVDGIHGMLYNGYGTTGVNGYEFREELFLLLKDGWAYFRDDIAPTDLDVAASRRLEPQMWGRWRAAGAGVELQRHDDNGQPAGEWRRQAGRLLPSWPRETRLAGSYTSKAFYGSIALGGTYSSTSYVFTNDGRYERLGFSRSSSGSMAANAPGEFSASASSASSGKGTQSDAGGGRPGVYTRSSSRTDDGAKHRGTYRLDGMMLELRSDAGEVVRTLCLPLRDDRTAMYLFGRSFSVER
jgi:hypothetical protein